MGTHNLSALGVFVTVAVVMVTISYFGGMAGFQPSWVPAAPTLSSTEPNFFDTFGGVWDGLQFFFGLMLFSIPNIPAIFSYIWILLIISLGGALLVFIRAGN